MNQKQYYNVVKWALENPQERISIVALGYTGIGKTQIPQQVAHDLGLDCRVINVANQEAVDVKGVPMPVLTSEGHVVKWVPMPEMEFLRTEPDDTTLVLVEEMPQADQSVQKAWANILERNTRGIDGNRISDKFVFVATGNRRQDRAGAHGILHHIESRFVFNVELAAEAGPWIEYSEGRISPAVLSYLVYAPDKIVVENPNVDAGWSVNPRNWDNVDVITRMEGVEEYVKHELILRKLGEEVGSDFIRHWKVALQLPSAQDVASDPNGASVPDKSSERWAMANALGRWADDENVGAFILYLNRFDAKGGGRKGMVENEWSRLFWHTVNKHGNPAARMTPEYQEFGLKMAEAYAH